MIDLSAVKIFVRPGSTDMRKQIDGLAAIVYENFKADPLDGSLYLFASRCLKKLKILYWDRNGFCLWQKRLEEDRFPWPKDEDEVKQISLAQLQMLLDGIDFWHAHPVRVYKFAG